MPMDYSLARLANRRHRRRTWLRGLHVDIPLLVGLLLLAVVGLTVLYSASAQSMDVLIRQLIRLALGFGVMLVLAHISPHHLERWTPWLYDLGVVRFQPSELMKLAVPLMVAWYVAERPLPPAYKVLGVAVLILVVPTLLIDEQPDHGTALLGAEFRLIGILLLLALYLFIIGRGLYIASEAQTSYTRLVAGSITLTFFVYVFVNIGMVTGLLPVVGVPLPLVSYGGTSLVTIMAAFGILMSIHTHRRLLPS